MAASLLLAACSGGADDPSPAAARAPASAPASVPAAAPPADRGQPAGEPQSAGRGAAQPAPAYRAMEATLRRTGEKIVIQVPDNIQIDKNRMIEIREGADGKYYFVSLIPN